jgi:hypothetical protein
MAYFNLREGRFRQNNLHLGAALQMGNRHYVDEMYENRYQKELFSQIRLAWRVIRREWRNLWVLGCYFAIHVSGLLDRRLHPSRRLDAQLRTAVGDRTRGERPARAASAP